MIADFLYASGDMEKKGSGLVDVKSLARKNNSVLKFHLDKLDEYFSISISARPEAIEREVGIRLPQHPRVFGVGIEPGADRVHPSG